jgi:hypothetical protein
VQTLLIPVKSLPQKKICGFRAEFTTFARKKSEIGVFDAVFFVAYWDLDSRGLIFLSQNGRHGN